MMINEVFGIIKNKFPDYIPPLSGNSGIYIIYNLISQKYYIGSSNDFHRRIATHFRNLSKGVGINSHFQFAYDKYGKESFVCELIENIEVYNKKYFLKRESFWITELNSIKNGYNITLADFGGDTMTNHPRKAEINLLKGEAVKKRNKLLDKAEYNRIYGTGVKRKPYPDDFGYNVSQRKAGENHHFFGKHLSIEHKDKLSKLFSGDKNPEAKAYSINGVIFTTRKEAAKVLGISYPTLRKRCNSDDVKWSSWKCLGYTKNLEVKND